jgi:nitric oxide reductase subunit B
MVKLDFRNTILSEDKTIYSEASAIAYKKNVEYLTNMLLNGDSTRGYPGGFIKD